MNIDPVTGSIVEFVIENGVCKFYCPKTEKYVNIESESNVLFESDSSKKFGVDVYQNFIYFSIYDRSIPKKYEECPECKNNVVSFVVIKMQQVFKCPKCKNTWSPLLKV